MEATDFPYGVRYTTSYGETSDFFRTPEEANKHARRVVTRFLRGMRRRHFLRDSLSILVFKRSAGFSFHVMARHRLTTDACWD
jgi:hypothetical protein